MHKVGCYHYGYVKTSACHMSQEYPQCHAWHIDHLLLRMHGLSTNMSTDTLQGVSTDPEKLGPKAAVVNGKNVLQLLNHCNGSFRPGILTALVGSSGAGKTTLMDVLAGRKTSKPTCAFRASDCAFPASDCAFPASQCAFPALHHIVSFLHQTVPFPTSSCALPASDCAFSHWSQDTIFVFPIGRVCITTEQSLASCGVCTLVYIHV